MQPCDSRDAGMIDGTPATDVGEYRLGKILGTGGFSVVRLATRAKTGERLACKVIDIRKRDEEEKTRSGIWRESLCLEIAAMTVIRHENVANVLSVNTTARFVYVFLELCESGTLFDRIKGTAGVDETTGASFLAQLILGLRCVHKFGVAHRDLKPENILLDEHGVLKLTDFGLCKLHAGSRMKVKQGDDLETHAVGTKQYVAPECLAGPYDAFRSDLWSLGVVVFVMLSGQFPFYDEDDHKLAKQIALGWSAIARWPMSSSPRDVIQKLLVVDPARRSSLASVWIHPYLSSAVRKYAADLETAGHLPLTSTPQFHRAHAPILHTHPKAAERHPSLPVLLPKVNASSISRPGNMPQKSPGRTELLQTAKK